MASDVTHMLRGSDRLLARAAAILRSTVAANPDDTASLQRLGDVHRGLGKLREALECYRRVLALRPDEPKALRLAAILSGQELPDASPSRRPLPFVRLEHFLPAQRCSELLALALASRERFEPAQILSQKDYVVRGVRRGLIANRRTTDQNVRPWFEAQLRRAFAETLPRLQIREPSKYWVDMRMSAYPGTCFFRRHTDEFAAHERRVSFVYYFHRQPRRFSGGDLLLHDGDGTQAFTRIEPQHNSIVLFPPAYLHEVVVVDSDSVDFGDSRFAIHGWLRTDLAAEIPGSGARTRRRRTIQERTPGTHLSMGGRSQVRDAGAKRSIARRRGFVWLASYPKSGNTWLRALLANVIAGADKAVPLNPLPFGTAVVNSYFDRLTGVPAEYCTADEIDSVTPAFLRKSLAELASADRPRLYRKVHCAYVANRAGQALLPDDVTAGVVYVVRNPLDVTVAWAHHAERGNCAKGIKRLNNKCATLGGPGNNQCRQRVLDWSSNVRSWCSVPFPLLVVRYEDMLADTVAELRRVARFLRLEDVSEARLRDAVADSSFANLRQTEEREGFGGKPTTNAGFFFREGRAGGWREHLSATQAREVVTAHWATMEAFGYDPGSALGAGERR